MRIAYLDCFSGISGDMTLGALIDAGVSAESIQEGIDSLGLPGCRLEVSEVKKHGFRATHVEVVHEPEHKHRHLHHIVAMIETSALSPPQQELAKRIFTRLGEAEAKVHGTTLEKVHFHEVGAVDSIADIVGSAIAWDLLGVDRIYCSPIPTGSGSVKIAHGTVAIPAPATAELLQGIPIAGSNVSAELTTPTGAAIAATLVDHFGELPPLQIQSIGYGAGTRDLDDRPNTLRLLVGSPVESITPRTVQEDRIWVLETNLDDVPGEWIGHCTQSLLEAGALDAYTTPIQMKKNRPAVTLTVLCNRRDIGSLERIIFRETGTLGVRRWETRRHVLPRETAEVETPWGNVHGKLARLEDEKERFAPEYEACRRVADASGQALREIYQAAQRAFDLSRRDGK